MYCCTQVVSTRTLTCPTQFTSKWLSMLIALLPVCLHVGVHAHQGSVHTRLTTFVRTLASAKGINSTLLWTGGWKPSGVGE